VDGKVKNRGMLATAGVLLALMPSAGLWHARNLLTALPSVSFERSGLAPLWTSAPVYGKVRNLVKSAPDDAIATPDFPHTSNGRRQPEPIQPLLAAQAVGDNLRMQTPAQLWQRWEMLLIRSQFQQIPIIGAMLAESLRKNPDPQIYQNIAHLLAQSDVSIENKAILLDLLGEIATPDSLSQLIGLAETEADSPLYISALQVISRIGDNRWDGRFHEELSPVLEAAWSNSDANDLAFLNAIAKAIAVVGAPEGVNQLLRTVAGRNPSKDTEEKSRAKQAAAFEAIPKIRNPDAVATLSEPFEQEPIGSPAFEASGDALAEIGSPAATQEILNWAQTAPPEGARRLEDWLPKIGDSESLALIAKSQQSSEFQSTEVAAVIDAAATQASSNASPSPAATESVALDILSLPSSLDE
jgi:hypothetical protein